MYEIGQDIYEKKLNHEMYFCTQLLDDNLIDPVTLKLASTLFFDSISLLYIYIKYYIILIIKLYIYIYFCYGSLKGEKVFFGDLPGGFNRLVPMFVSFEHA